MRNEDQRFNDYFTFLITWLLILSIQLTVPALHYQYKMPSLITPPHIGLEAYMIFMLTAHLSICLSFHIIYFFPDNLCISGWIKLILQRYIQYKKERNGYIFLSHPIQDGCLSAKFIKNLYGSGQTVVRDVSFNINFAKFRDFHEIKNY